ncbi:hypothetical protein AV530_016772 [Patagioenas fasciata monilis]|uniref:Uncharacterized protein n=1 Tax=Patagioenas fasciata monilis TaxID=372326 RepID=A0A1V4J3M5_PATFA|nr:hypothetical protein AV530_016772 [Patagioenas fasciata monilis]
MTEVVGPVQEYICILVTHQQVPLTSSSSKSSERTGCTEDNIDNVCFMQGPQSLPEELNSKGIKIEIAPVGNF